MAGPANGLMSLEPTVDASLSQQSDIDAKLALLLPQKYALSARAELVHLRHKLRVLRTFANEHRLLAHVPVLSEIEEARQLQYQIECIEFVCLENGHNFHDPHVVDGLDFIHQADAPFGFSEWLRKNFQEHDPAVRAWKHKTEAPSLGSRVTNRSRPTPCHFPKCSDENCVHYVYGFLHPDELDQHYRSHALHAKRDSGLSVSSGVASAPFQPDPSRQLGSSREPSPSSPAHFHPPLPYQASRKVQLPPLPRTGQKRDHHELSGAFPYFSDFAAAGGVRGSTEPESDALLPPLKRNRGGATRLESIGELRLLRELDTCLRCRVLLRKSCSMLPKSSPAPVVCSWFWRGPAPPWQRDLPQDVQAIFRYSELTRQCDSSTVCLQCHSPASDEAADDLWKAIGCHRGPLGSTASIFVPAFLSPGRGHTPIASPHAQRLNMNDYLDRVYALHDGAAKVVKTNLDFDDEFWWTEDLATLPILDPARASFGTQANDRPPPILRVFASSQNMRGAAYNFWQLLKLSGLLSINRHTEAMSFPTLHQAKLLLREVLFLDLQQPEPSIIADAAFPAHEPLPDDFERHNRYSIVTTCMAQYLDSLETFSTQGESAGPKQRLAAFFSLCIFSIVRTILVEMILVHYRRIGQPQVDGGEAHTSKLHAVYKAAVFLLGGQLASLLDEDGSRMLGEDNELYNTASMIVKRNIWSQWGLASTMSFLLSLGTLELERGLWQGFLRQVAPDEHTRMQTVYYGPIRAMSHSLTPLLSAQQSNGNPWPDITEPREPIPPREVPDEASAASPEGATSDDRRNRIENGAAYMGSPSLWRKGGQLTTSPIQTPRIKPPQQKPPGRRAYCNICNEVPEGFPGDYELRRHTDAKHSSPARGWICTEPSRTGAAAGLRPLIPLSKCKSCVRKRAYAAYYSAAIHLRRQHFISPETGKAGSEVPPIAGLEDWIREVCLPHDVREDMLLSDGEDESDFGLPVKMSSLPDPHLRHNASPASDANPVSSASPISLQNHSHLHLPELGSGRTLPAPMLSNAAQISPTQVTKSEATLVPLSQIPHVQPHVLSKQSSSHPPAAQTLPLHKMFAPSLTAPGPMPAVQLSRQVRFSQKASSFHSLSNSLVTGSEEQRHPNRNQCPYPECGRVFKDLAAHMLTHMEERPEKCPIESCEYHTKGFARKYDKNRHALTHYKGTMVCPFCHGAGTAYEKAFNRADVFKRHLTAVHNVEQTPPNSKKMVTVLGSSRQTSANPGDRGNHDLAKCSICRSHFLTAQEFYEHLDDCVLNVIVPSTPRVSGTAGLGPPRSSGDTNPPATSISANAIAAKLPPRAKSTRTTNPDLTEQLRVVQPCEHGPVPQECEPVARGTHEPGFPGHGVETPAQTQPGHALQ